MTRKTRIITLGLAAAIVATGLIALGGDLNPPAGPVSSTMKTLTEVEPRIAVNATNTPGDADSLYKITQPGSYYLTGNVHGVFAKHGIEIASSNVSLDLMGFAVIGTGATLDGVSATVNSSANIRIVNGTVSGWGGSGINLQSAVVTNAIVENIAVRTSGVGILVYNSVVRACVASGNSSAGIRSTEASTITDCTAFQNFGYGFYLDNNSLIRGCTATYNTNDGIVVISRCHVLNNNCGSNGNNGDGAGIHVNLSNNHIEGNHCYASDRGIDVDSAGNVIVRNTCSGNTTNNWDVAAGNVCLVVQATTSGAITGNSGGVGPGSTDPNANFSY